MLPKNMAMLLFLFVVVSLAGNCQGKIREVADRNPRAAGISNCPSWRLAAEANNTIGWLFTPSECYDYVKEYLLGGQYSLDSEFVADEAINYAQNLALPRDGRNLWIFDIDDTSLSNIDLFINLGLRSKPTKAEEVSPALPETKRLYKTVLSQGIKVVFLTGRPESVLDETIANLVAEGYTTWEKLILRTEEFLNKTAIEYKSTVRSRLEKGGYRIVGNIGDQWSDLSGPSHGWRMFKLPNPMYYLN